MQPANSFADIRSVLQLEHQYFLRIDHISSAAVSALWHPEGSLELSFTPRATRLVGREAVARWYRESHGGGSERRGVDFPRHSIAAPRVTFTGPDKALVETDIWSHDVRESTPRFYSAYYRDEAVRWNGRWWFWVKRIHLRASWSGELAGGQP